MQWTELGMGLTGQTTVLPLLFSVQKEKNELLM